MKCSALYPSVPFVHLAGSAARTAAMILAVATAALPSDARAVDFSYDANGTVNWTVIPWTPVGTPGPADNVSVSSTNTNSTLSINTAVSISNFSKTGSLGLFLNDVNAPRTFTIGSGLSVTEGTLTLRNQNSTNVLSVSTGGFSVASGAQFALGLAASNNGRPVFTAAATSTNLVQGNVIINGYNSTVQTTQPAVSLGHLVLDGGSVNLSAGTTNERTVNNVTVSSLSSVGSGVRTVTTTESDGVTAVSTLVIGGLNGAPADFAGTINNNVSILKEGAGTQVFSGTNNYKGTTTVSAGSLIIDGSVAGGVISVSNGATLGGAGTIAGTAAVIDGTLAPGGLTNRGTLTSGSVVTVGGTARFRVAAAGDYDVLSAVSAALNGTVQVVFIPGYSPASGDNFDFINATLSGSPVLDLPDLSTNGLFWVTNSFAVDGVIGITNSLGPTNGYAGWLTNYPGLTNTNPSANPDVDSFDNFGEYAFGGDPGIGSPAFLTASKAGTNAVFQFVARTASTGNYAVLSTTNLATGPWITNTNVVVTDATNQSGVLLPADYVRREFVVPAAGQGFYRVEGSPE